MYTYLSVIVLCVLIGLYFATGYQTRKESMRGLVIWTTVPTCLVILPLCITFVIGGIDAFSFMM